MEKEGLRIDHQKKFSELPKLKQAIDNMDIKGNKPLDINPPKKPLTLVPGIEMDFKDRAALEILCTMLGDNIRLKKLEDQCEKKKLNPYSLLSNNAYAFADALWNESLRRRGVV